MAIFKEMTVQVESFEFGNLDDPEKQNHFEFRELTSSQNSFKPQQLRTEQTLAGQKQFKISPVVMQYRGIMDQEKNDIEQKIEQEIEKRFELIQQKAYQEGFKEGKLEGKQKAYDEAKVEFEEKLMTLEGFLEQTRLSKNDLLDEHRDQIYRVTKNLIKWVILKEIKDDSYLPALLEKMILEINEKNNLLLKINSHDFEDFSKTIQYVEEKLGELRNVRVERDLEMKHRGIIVESENGILDGTIEAQFSAIDKLFAGIGLNEQEEEIVEEQGENENSTESDS